MSDYVQVSSYYLLVLSAQFFSSTPKKFILFSMI